MTKKIYILDTSALLSGKPLHLPNAQLMIPPTVQEEIKPGGNDYQNLQLLKEKGLQTQIPTSRAIHQVQNTAQQTGDFNRLSKADIHVLALAYDLQQQQHQNTITIITDDYAIQNTAHHLNIPFISLTQQGIKQPIKWKQICPACGKDIPPQEQICPICGTPYRLSPKKPR